MKLFPLKLGGGGIKDGLKPFVDGMFFDLGKDGEAFLRREPGGRDGGLEADARGFVRGGLFEEGGLVGKVALIPENFDGGSADAVIISGEKFL